MGEPIANWTKAIAPSNTTVIVRMTVKHNRFELTKIINFIVDCICWHLYRVLLVSNYCNQNNNNDYVLFQN